MTIPIYTVLPYCVIVYCTFDLLPLFILTSESLHMHKDIVKGCKGVDGGGWT